MQSALSENHPIWKLNNLMRGIHQSFKRETTEEGSFDMLKVYPVHGWVQSQTQDTIQCPSTTPLNVDDCQKLVHDVFDIMPKNKGCSNVKPNMRSLNTLQMNISMDRYHRMIVPNTELFNNIGIYGIDDPFTMFTVFCFAVKLNRLVKDAKDAGEKYLEYTVS